MNDVAYWGMLPSLTSNQKDRNTLVTLMSVFICIGQFSVAGILPTVIAGNAVKAYRIAALIIALCFIGFQLLTFFGVRERKRHDNYDKLSLKDMFKIFLRNDQLIAIGISYLLFTVGSGLLIVFAVNFFYFEFGYSQGGNLIFMFTVMYGLGTLISQAMFSLFTSHFSRKKLLKLCTVALIAFYVLLMMFGYIIPKNTILLNVIGFFIFFFQGIFNLVLIVMLNNTIEYDEYRYNERHESIISTVRSFGAKLGGAVNQGISALILIISGIYAISQKITDLEVLSGKGEIAKSEVFSRAGKYISTVEFSQTFILRIGMVLIPVITILLSYIVIRRKYKIYEDEYERIVGEINKRNK